jgi:tetratricopeptide (TPR) repeat protein
MAEQGHMELAQAEMHRLLMYAQDHKVHALAFSTLGEYMLDLGDVEGATSYFVLACETDTSNPSPWLALGDMAKEGERWEEALGCYEEALQRDPGNAEIKIQMGYVLVEENRPSEAEGFFRQALASDSGEYSAYLGLSECYRLLGKIHEQVAMVKQAMDIAPEDSDVWNAQGVAHEMEGRLKEATDAYTRALSLSPYHRKAANNLGFVLEKRIAQGESDLSPRAVEAWKQRLLICRDEGQSLKMATGHLTKLGVNEADIQLWLDTESVFASS